MGLSTRIAALAIAATIMLGLHVHRSPATEPVGQPHVMGHQQCVDCHGLSVEAWMRSTHSQRSLDMVDSNLRASRYTGRLGIDDLEGSSCLDCHSTQQKTEHGSLRVLGGVSCESCHGAAGPTGTSEGWYGLHCGEASLPEGGNADLDTVLKNLGMARTEDLYLLAVRCYNCHSVSDEEVVHAGHVTGTHEFELTSWFAGEVRHNFAPYTVDCEDEEKNAAASNLWLSKHNEERPRGRQRLMFVIGHMADLEVSLRNRAKATQQGTFATSAASRATAAFSQLRQIADLLNDAEFSAMLADLQPARSLLFLPPQPGHESKLVEAADRVSQVGQQFADEHCGSDLAAIDPLMSGETKGQAYQP